MTRETFAGGRKWTFWTSVSIIGFIVLLGITLAVVRWVSDGNAGDAATSPSPRASAGDYRCADAQSSQQMRLDVAPAAAWAEFGGFRFPIPQSQQDAVGVLRCFEHSPEGAVFAAAAGVSQLSDRELVVEVLKTRVQPSAVQASMLAEVEARGDDLPDANVRTRVAGFRLAGYDGTRARVDVGFEVERAGATRFFTQLVPLAWDEERQDWLLAFSERDQGGVVELTSLAGYTLWERGES